MNSMSISLLHWMHQDMGYAPLLINIYWAMLNFMQHGEKKQSPISLNKSISINQAIIQL